MSPFREDYPVEFEIPRESAATVLEVHEFSETAQAYLGQYYERLEHEVEGIKGSAVYRRGLILRGREAIKTSASRVDDLPAEAAAAFREQSQRAALLAGLGLESGSSQEEELLTAADIITAYTGEFTGQAVPAEDINTATMARLSEAFFIQARAADRAATTLEQEIAARSLARRALTGGKLKDASQNLRVDAVELAILAITCGAQIEYVHELRSTEKSTAAEFASTEVRPEVAQRAEEQRLLAEAIAKTQAQAELLAQIGTTNLALLQTFCRHYGKEGPTPDEVPALADIVISSARKLVEQQLRDIIRPDVEETATERRGPDAKPNPEEWQTHMDGALNLIGPLEELPLVKQGSLSILQEALDIGAEAVENNASPGEEIQGALNKNKRTAILAVILTAAALSKYQGEMGRDVGLGPWLSAPDIRAAQRLQEMIATAQLLPPEFDLSQFRGMPDRADPAWTLVTQIQGLNRDLTEMIGGAGIEDPKKLAPEALSHLLHPELLSDTDPTAFALSLPKH
ncbi:hypothetical protein KJ608_04160 [Patescibacteria group bacterium]|nr:hypothetical protein [Patescibacteria group bacterium]